jgi:hypothetical protein
MLDSTGCMQQKVSCTHCTLRGWGIAHLHSISHVKLIVSDIELISG